MKISLNVQSYKRAGNLPTLVLLPRCNLWVHEFEAAEYEKHASADVAVRVLPDALRGNLSKVKNHVLEAEGEADVVAFLDDDMRRLRYWDNKESYDLAPDDILPFVEHYSVLCAEWGFKLWGVNVTNDKQVYREYIPFSTLSYASSSFACFLKGNRLRYDERFPLKEDYDMTIQQCNVYRGLLRVNRYYYDKGSAENVGGCATYRNVERERQQLRELQKKWGKHIVRLERLGNSRSHSSTKKRTVDINPIIHIPILGV